MVIHDQQASQSPWPSASVSENSEASGSVTSTEPEQPPPFVMVSWLPELEGGNLALRKKITNSEEAIQNNIEGIVRVQFKIDGHGENTDFTVTEGIGYGCDETVIRAILDSDFKPGRGPGGAGLMSSGPSQLN